VTTVVLVSIGGNACATSTSLGEIDPESREKLDPTAAVPGHSPSVRAANKACSSVLKNS
jgi:hypothetical protein